MASFRYCPDGLQVSTWIPWSPSHALRTPHSALDRALAATATLTAVLLGACFQLGVARGQIPPPTICKAININVPVPKTPTTKWVTTPTKGWQYTWDWTVEFDCSSGDFSNCDVDAANSTAVWDPVAGRFGTAQWAYICSNAFEGCNTAGYERQVRTTYPSMGGIPPDTIFKITFYVASHDPSIMDCSDQSYSFWGTVLYQVPPEP